MILWIIINIHAVSILISALDFLESFISFVMNSERCLRIELAVSCLHGSQFSPWTIYSPSSILLLTLLYSFFHFLSCSLFFSPLHCLLFLAPFSNFFSSEPKCFQIKWNTHILELTERCSCSRTSLDLLCQIVEFWPTNQNLNKNIPIPNSIY